MEGLVSRNALSLHDFVVPFREGGGEWWGGGGGGYDRLL
jgi:hypothetical protein